MSDEGRTPPSYWAAFVLSGTGADDCRGWPTDGSRGGTATRCHCPTAAALALALAALSATWALDGEGKEDAARKADPGRHAPLVGVTDDPNLAKHLWLEGGRTMCC